MGPIKCPVYIKILWIVSSGYFFTNKISSTEIHCFDSIVEHTIFTSRSAFLSIRKDILPTLLQNLVIYCFEYPIDGDYVGKTIQQSEVRTAQHVADSICTLAPIASSWYSQMHESAIGKHLLNTNAHPVSWSCRIHRLLLCRRVWHPQRVSWYDTKQSDGEVPAMLEFWGMRSIPSLSSLPGPLWPGVLAPDMGPIYWLNRTNSVLMLNWIVWLN